MIVTSDTKHYGRNIYANCIITRKYAKQPNSANMNPIPYLIALMLTAPVAQVESNGNPCAYNATEDAAGCMQIRPIMVAEAQRLGLNFTMDDRWDCDKSKGLFVAMQVLKGRTNPEVMARCWNGGPNGMKKESTRNYWVKVKKQIKQSNNQ